MDNDVKVCKNWIKPLIEELQNKEIGAVLPISKCKEDINFQERLDGFCWLIRREVWSNVGPVSEEYGLAYFEDTDYWMRLKRAGYKIIAVSKSKVYHYSRATTDKMPWLKALYIRNKDKYEQKWNYEYPQLDDI